MTVHADPAELAYADAEASLLTYADDDCLADRIMTIDQYRRAYESVRTDLLENYPGLDGPRIGDLLGEAAGVVWPSIIRDL